MPQNLDIKRIVSLGILFAFLVNTLGPIPAARADEFFLPAPGQMVALSPAFSPAVLKGIKLDPKNPFRFHFFVDSGDDSSLRAPEGRSNLKQESAKLIKYFLVSLTIPEKDLWVNLSPYEKDRIVPQEFGQTEMGRDLLAQDYLLKQITASLIYPESQLGKEFWAKVYAQAQAKYGTTNIPINTFNKVWIVPEKAVVYENGGVAFVLENHLKVMLEQDYLSLQKHQLPTRGHVIDTSQTTNPAAKQVIAGIVSPSRLPSDSALKLKASQGNNPPTNEMASNIIREIVIPALTKEVNEGKNFSQLRQVFYSLILATWYKKKIKDSILNKVYSNQNKIGGVNVSAENKDKIYQEYLKAFKKGVYNYIKEESDLITGQNIPRKYFSGGVIGSVDPVMIYEERISSSQISGLDSAQLVDIKGDMAMINPIPASSTEAVSVVELPKSQTAIQKFMADVSPVVNMEELGALTARIGSKYLALVKRFEEESEEKESPFSSSIAWTDYHNHKSGWVLQSSMGAEGRYDFRYTHQKREDLAFLESLSINLDKENSLRVFAPGTELEVRQHAPEVVHMESRSIPGRMKVMVVDPSSKWFKENMRHAFSDYLERYPALLEELHQCQENLRVWQDRQHEDKTKKERKWTDQQMIDAIKYWEEKRAEIEKSMADFRISFEKLKMMLRDRVVFVRMQNREEAYPLESVVSAQEAGFASPLDILRRVEEFYPVIEDLLLTGKVPKRVSSDLLALPSSQGKISTDSKESRGSKGEVTDSEMNTDLPEGDNALQDGAMTSNIVANNLFPNRVLIGSSEYSVKEIHTLLDHFNEKKLQMGTDIPIVFSELTEKVEAIAIKTEQRINERFLPRGTFRSSRQMIEQFKMIYSMAFENGIDTFLQKREMLPPELRALFNKLVMSYYFYVLPKENGTEARFCLMVVNNGVPLKIAEVTEYKKKRRIIRGLGNFDRFGGTGLALRHFIAGAVKQLSGQDTQSEVRLFDRQQTLGDGEEGAVLDIRIPLNSILKLIGVDPTTRDGAMRATAARIYAKVLESQADRDRFVELIEKGETVEAKRLLFSSKQYQSFQFKPQQALNPGGLDLKIFQLFPNLREVHFVNNNPFRVQYKNINGRVKDSLRFNFDGSVDRGEKAFVRMLRSYLSQSEQSVFIFDGLQNEIVYGKAHPLKGSEPTQIGLEPFIIADLERMGNHIIENTSPEANVYKIEFVDIFGDEKTLYYHQQNVFSLHSSEVLSQEMLAKKFDLLFIKAFSSYSLPNEFWEAIKEGKLFVSDSSGHPPLDKNFKKIGKMAGQGTLWGMMGYDGSLDVFQHSPLMYAQSTTRIRKNTRKPAQMLSILSSSADGAMESDIEHFMNHYSGSIYYPSAGLDLRSLVTLVNHFPRVSNFTFVDHLNIGENMWLSRQVGYWPNELPAQARLIERLLVREFDMYFKKISVSITDQKKKELLITLVFNDDWMLEGFHLNEHVPGRVVKIRYIIGSAFDFNEHFDVIYVQGAGYGGELSENPRFWNKLDQQLTKNGYLLVSREMGSAPSPNVFIRKGHAAGLEWHEKGIDIYQRSLDANASSDPGGIDLNPAQMSMQVKKNGRDFKFDFNGTEINAAQVTGVTFTINQMTPVTNLFEVLGLNQNPAEPHPESLAKV